MKRRNNGITVIALVITIIVLLILAGVSIATLTGDNGLIRKTVEAKNATEELAIKEDLEVTVLTSYEKGDINYNLLNDKLKKVQELKYKENTISEENKITELPVVVKIKGYEFDILEDGTVEKRPDYETMRNMYGTELNGYTAGSGNEFDESNKVDSWKLFYVDEENREVFVISSNTTYPSMLQENGIPVCKSNGEEYSGIEDIEKFEYSQKYNQVWIKSYPAYLGTAGNRKAIAYLCDPNNWKQYVTGKAKYAAGAPTMEMFTASVQEKQVKDLDITISSGSCGDGITPKIKNGLYNNSSKSYWMASSDYGDVRTIYFFNGSNKANSEKYSWTSPGLRPVVCFQASDIKIDGDKLSI